VAANSATTSALLLAQRRSAAPHIRFSYHPLRVAQPHIISAQKTLRKTRGVTRDPARRAQTRGCRVIRRQAHLVSWRCWDFTTIVLVKQRRNVTWLLLPYAASARVRRIAAQQKNNVARHIGISGGITPLARLAPWRSIAPSSWRQRQRLGMTYLFF